MPATLPLASLAPWTGWLAFDESDLVVLGAIAGGHARRAWEARRGAPARRAPAPAPPDAWLLAAFAALAAVAFVRGVADAGGWRFDLFQHHDGPLNAWRVTKPIVYALLLAPLAWRLLGEAPVATVRRLAHGVLAGLAVVSLAVLWERAAHPGLHDWTDPYRVTALFWEMHVGGAAIDAHLVLSMPFLAWALLDARTPARWTLLALLAVLAVHACLATFARGVYGGVVASLLLMAVAHLVQRRGRPGGALRAGPPPPWRGLANALLAAVLVAECVAAFVAGSFARERTSEIVVDFGGRLAHWRRGLALPQGPAEWLLGVGAGRVPARYMQAPDGHERPGSAGPVETADGRPVVRLGGPALDPALGGLYALTQRVPLQPGVHRVALEVRASRDAELDARVCERHLLYPRNCLRAVLRVAAGGDWQRVAAPLAGAAPDGGTWYAPRLGMFSLAVRTPAAVVEVREVGLAAPGGESLLVNGDFRDGLARWFPVARAYFVPWHVDSLWLELLVERGALALALFAALAWRAFGRLRDALPDGCGGVALPAAAALAGVLLVGVVSSVLDMPRVALLLWLALLLPLGARHRRAVASR